MENDHGKHHVVKYSDITHRDEFYDLEAMFSVLGGKHQG